MCHVREGCMIPWPGLSSLLVLCLTLLPQTATDCDVTIRSSDGTKNGTFQSPNWPNNYKENLRCIYKFIGLPNERVQISYTHFQVRGVPPRCTHDYVDMYTQVISEEEDVLDIPLHGRFCGNDMESLPKLLISMHKIFIIGFYTDDQKNDRGFQGIFTFIDGSKYVVGIPDPDSPQVCGQTIRSDRVSRGMIYSPTYPGTYPDNVDCYYKIKGQAGQRIRLNFQDLDLYSGGEHCPFDYVKVYDGYTNEAEVIGIYCGKHKNIELFSTTDEMRIEFRTKSGRVEPTKKTYLTYLEIEEDNQRKGFKAYFEISYNFVNLDFIHEGHHVRGTECDQRVLSDKETNGTITSPNFPGKYPLNITCRYYVDGLVDRQNLEKAKLTFEHFEIPVKKEKCDNGYMASYLRGQDMTEEGPDKILCGRQIPQPLITSDPRLFLVFDTRGTLSGKGFKAHYQFLTDYAIPGTPATDAKCHFLYHSASAKAGQFNSPRHPSNYPHNTICTYEFFGLVREQVRITFGQKFDVENRHGNCTTDYLQVFAVSSSLATNETLIGHFCGKYVPGPLVSEDANIVKVVFHTDAMEQKSGWRAKYEFIERKPLSKRCHMDITRGGGGLIRSPNYPLKYLINTTCEWHIYATQPKARILLQFASFSMEGNLGHDGHGCANAILKIYTNNSGMPANELCGPSPSNIRQIISDHTYMKIKFISSARAVGAKGFKISWTEIQNPPGSVCSGFKCQRSGYCIAKSLKCNNLPNCGEGDISDEEEKCAPSYTDHGVLHIILGVVIALVLFIFLLVCILHRRRKARHRHRGNNEIEVRYVTRGCGAVVRDPRDGGPRPDQSLLKERTEKVSIV